MLVHGGGVAADSWVRNILDLAERFTVVAPDTLGHGFTGRGALDGGPPQPHMVRHLVALADHLGLDSFALCGSSFGAMLCMLTYFEIPERVTRMMLLSSASATLDEAELMTSLQAAYQNGSSAIHDPTYEKCQTRMARINHSPDAVKPEVILMQLNIYSQSDAARNYDLVMKGLMRIEECRPFRVAERFAAVRVPTLLVWGKDDPRVIMARAIDAARAMECGYLVAMDQCCHEPHVEQPEKFNRLVKHFMQGGDLEGFRIGADGQVAIV
jgi:2-hydroxy-6-oxonona-2,4-dienedioate hydrolase